MVLESDASAKRGAVVIHPQVAAVARAAVVRPGRLREAARWAEREFRKFALVRKSVAVAQGRQGPPGVAAHGAHQGYEGHHVGK